MTGLSAWQEKRETAATSLPLRHSDERRTLFSFRVPESDTLLDLIDHTRDQLPSLVSRSALVLRDTIEMSLSAFKRFERASHVRLASNRDTSAEANCGSIPSSPELYHI